MTMNGVRTSAGGGAFIGIGVAFILLAVVGIVLYATGAPDAANAGSPETGVLRAVTIIGAAICGGVGALLLVLGVIKRRPKPDVGTPPS